MVTSEENSSKFWSLQPVLTDDSKSIGPVEETKLIPSTPSELPNGLQWVTLNLSDDLDDLIELLKKNYVEDDICDFRFNYEKKQILAFTEVSNETSLYIGILKNNELVGSILAVPRLIKIDEKTVRVAVVDFLCVHKSLRSKTLCPALILELKRRCNLIGIFQALYTSATDLPSSVAAARYYHRIINPRICMNIGFVPKISCSFETWEREEMLIKSQLVLRELQETDTKEAFKLISEHKKRFRIALLYSETDLWTILKPRTYNYTWVIRMTRKEAGIKDVSVDWALEYLKNISCEYNHDDIIAELKNLDKVKDQNNTGKSKNTKHHRVPKNKKKEEQIARQLKISYLKEVVVTDLISFYVIPTVLVNDPGTFQIAYLQDLVCTTTSQEDLLNAALHLLKSKNCIAANALGIEDWMNFLSQSAWKPGSGFLKYYLFNWNQPKGTGSYDTTMWEWLTSVQQDTLATMLASPSLQLLVAVSENESVAKSRYNIIEQMINPCGHRPDTPAENKKLTMYK